MIKNLYYDTRLILNIDSFFKNMKIEFRNNTLERINKYLLFVTQKLFLNYKETWDSRKIVIASPPSQIQPSLVYRLVN